MGWCCDGAIMKTLRFQPQPRVRTCEFGTSDELGTVSSVCTNVPVTMPLARVIIIMVKVGSLLGTLATVSVAVSTVGSFRSET
jgi:hypothetical protein